MFDQSIMEAARELTQRCLAGKLRMAFAESCTGGLIAGAMTELPGSSRVVDRCFVVYSNQAKEEMLGVPRSLIQEHGAVSEAVAMSMVDGALAQAADAAQLAVAVTGVAGPDDSEAKPAGRVHLAAKRSGRPALHQQHDFGPIGRAEVRAASVLAALQLAIRAIDA